MTHLLLYHVIFKNAQYDQFCFTASCKALYGRILRVNIEINKVACSIIIIFFMFLFYCIKITTMELHLSFTILLPTLFNYVLVCTWHVQLASIGHKVSNMIF